MGGRAGGEKTVPRIVLLGWSCGGGGGGRVCDYLLWEAPDKDRLWKRASQDFFVFCAIPFASGHMYQGIALGTKRPVSCALGWLYLV
jgi:hypothetical protein